MTNILALDTASRILSVAARGPEGTFLAESRRNSGYSGLLMDMTVFVLESAGLEREELEAVACMEGPGSFTGLRTGFATAKGFSLALGIPLIPVPSLDCIAWPHSHWPGPVVAALDAKGNRFFTGLYLAGRQIAGPVDAAPAEIAALAAAASREPALIAGPDTPLLMESLGPLLPEAVPDPAHRRGRAAELLEIAAQNTLLLKASDSAGPVYIRKSGAETGF